MTNHERDKIAKGIIINIPWTNRQIAQAMDYTEAAWSRKLNGKAPWHSRDILALTRLQEMQAETGDAWERAKQLTK